MRTLIATPLAIAAALLTQAGPAHASTGMATTAGWVRLANLSSTAGTCDLYLYSFNHPQALMVLNNVQYGHVSAYAELPAGDYTVAMRLAGQPSNAPAITTTALMLMGNMQYTVAAMGAGSRYQFQTFVDSDAVATGETAVRVLQAASTVSTVTANVGQQQVANDLRFGDITHYQTLPAGSQQISLTSSAGQATADITLPANSTHTLVVLDGSGGPRITDLTDAAGVTASPQGGAATGFGGTAPQPAPSALPWLAVIAAGALVAVGGIWRRRVSTTR